MNRNAVVIGAGALGKALAYGLHQAALGRVGLYGRSGPVTRSFSIRDRQIIHEVLLPSDQNFEASQYFFATKAYALPAALRDWLPRIAPASRIVILCNGYIEPLLVGIRSDFPRHVLNKGVVTRGAKFLPTGVLELSEQGHISWGEAGPINDFEQSLFALRPEFRWDAEACRSRRDKWYCNTVLNTLCGAYRLPSNGAALKHPDYPALADEVYTLGCKLWPEWTTDGERTRLKTLMGNLIRATEANENSMAADVRLQRPTEIAVLSGIAKTLPGHEQAFPLLTKLHGTIEHMRT